MPDTILSDYLDVDALAAELSTSTRTLKRWRDHGTGPAYTKIGARILYRRGAVDDWLLQNERR